MDDLWDRIAGPQAEPSAGAEKGIDAFRLAELPLAVRRVMRVMLRHAESEYVELCRAVEALPEDQRVSRSELDAALAALCEQHWLTRAVDGERVTYRLNFRQRAASLATLRPRRRSGQTLDRSIWDMLDFAMPDDPKHGQGTDSA